MDSPVVGAILCFIGGALVATLNHVINLYVLHNKPQAYAKLSTLRTVLSALYLIIIYILSFRLPWGIRAMLIGAGLGLTIPSMIYAVLLTKENDRLKAEREAAEDAAEEDDGDV